MAKPLFRRMAAAVMSTALVAALAACGASRNGGDNDPASGDAPDLDADVTISINDFPTKEEPEARQNVLDKIADFEELNPNITIEPTEYNWSADSFAPMLAGGTEPTVTRLPFTEIQGLIARGQAADITDAAQNAGFLEELSPSLIEVVSDSDGRVYGVPDAAYTVGLLYNRALFTEAGLDPDDPPQTWDDIRAAAKTINEKTGEPGLITMSAGNVGGWTLTAMSYAFGELLEEVDGDTATATINNDATKQALEFFQQLRWEDGTMGENFLLDIDDARNEFAAGRAGMMISGADGYADIVANRGLPKDDFGVAPLAMDDDSLGALGGGTINMISAKATPEQVAAAIKWIQYHKFNKFIHEDQAKGDAAAVAADDRPVGQPNLPVVSEERNDQYLEWIDEYINVPLENFELYMSTVNDIPLVPEPPAKGQELYAALDPVVQAVLTREDADIDALLQEAEDTVNSLIAAG